MFEPLCLFRLKVVISFIQCLLSCGQPSLTSSVSSDPAVRYQVVRSTSLFGTLVSNTVSVLSVSCSLPARLRTLFSVSTSLGYDYAKCFIPYEK